MESKETGDIKRRFTITLSGVALYLLLDFVAQLLPPHYSAISQPESDLAVGQYGYIMTVNFLNRGLLSAEFLLAMVGTVRLSQAEFSAYRTGFYLLGAWSLGAVLLAIFPTDVPSTPVSWHGAIHLLVAVIAFIGGGIGALLVSSRMRQTRSLQGASLLAFPLAALSAILCLAELLGPFLAPNLVAGYGGLLERFFLGSVLFWMAAVSTYMLLHKSRAA